MLERDELAVEETSRPREASATEETAIESRRNLLIEASQVVSDSIRDVVMRNYHDTRRAYCEPDIRGGVTNVGRHRAQCSRTELYMDLRKTLKHL